MLHELRLVDETYGRAWWLAAASLSDLRQQEHLPPQMSSGITADMTHVATRQCRQKTVEVKAKCTKCTLHWCPRCLLNRYGEEVAKVSWLSYIVYTTACMQLRDEQKCIHPACTTLHALGNLHSTMQLRLACRFPHWGTGAAHAAANCATAATAVRCVLSEELFDLVISQWAALRSQRCHQPAILPHCRH